MTTSVEEKARLLEEAVVKVVAAWKRVNGKTEVTLDVTQAIAEALDDLLEVVEVVHAPEESVVLTVSSSAEALAGEARTRRRRLRVFVPHNTPMSEIVGAWEALTSMLAGDPLLKPEGRLFFDSVMESFEDEITAATALTMPQRGEA